MVALLTIGLEGRLPVDFRWIASGKASDNLQKACVGPYGSRIYYFLETTVRVGSAYIADLARTPTTGEVREEWKAVDATSSEVRYSLPSRAGDQTGVPISPARQDWPEIASFKDLKLLAWNTKQSAYRGCSKVFCLKPYHRIVQAMDNSRQEGRAKVVAYLREKREVIEIDHSGWC